MVHISELSSEFVKNIGDVVSQGDVITVKVIAIDDQGRIRLSRKAVELDAANEEAESTEEETASQPA